MSSVRKVAAEAGVSPSTVSRIFNNEPDVDEKTRERVLAVANKIGYAPKIGRRINTILGVGLAQSGPRDLGTFEGALVAGAAHGCREAGFHVAVVDIMSERRPREAFTHFFARIGVRGVLLRRLPSLERLLDDLVRESFPHVLVADRSEIEGVAWIDTDSKTPSAEAVKHLLDLGHRRILLGRYSSGGVDTADRYEGYIEAHKQAGVPIDESLMLDCGDQFEDGARAADYAMAMPNPPTAFYMTHSMSSIGAFLRLAERGVRIPEDVSFVGFDDCDARVLTHPRMTVVRQDTFDMSHRAAKWLIDSIGDSKSEPIRVSLPGIFEVNQSTTLAPGTPIRVLPDGRILVTGEPGSSRDAGDSAR
ncbi:MAG: LacI family DNA-binding transcriptional regulator [Planctomycetota bacterium]